jgi:hypothetical protein
MPTLCCLNLGAPRGLAAHSAQPFRPTYKVGDAGKSVLPRNHLLPGASQVKLEASVRLLWPK